MVSESEFLGGGEGGGRRYLLGNQETRVIILG